MEREEILRRNKDAHLQDEGQQFMESHARRYGEIGLAVFFILITLYKLVKGIPSQDTLAIFWGYLGLTYIYKYVYTRSRQQLFQAACGMLAAVAFTIAYLLQTW
jgi:hypothetical protein